MMIIQIFVSNLAYNSTHTQISSVAHIDLKIDRLTYKCIKMISIFSVHLCVRGLFIRDLGERYLLENFHSRSA